MKLYGATAVQQLIDKYLEIGGKAVELIEGSLGYGLTVCMASGYKTAVITEVPINSWSSGHKIRMYNQIPKKYQQMLDNEPTAIYEVWHI